MTKYEPLGKFLSAQSRERIPMTFAEIERLLNARLPPSKQNRAWWSNNPNNNVMTRQWLKAGYETEAVDIAGEKLVFKRVKGTPGARRPEAGQRKSIFGCMKGMITFAPGFDPTAPTFAEEDWSDSQIGGLDTLK